MGTWKDLFTNQKATGKVWRNIFKENFDKKKFLDASDAVYICKKAQADTYEEIINKLRGKVDSNIIETLKRDLDNHWKRDDSAISL